ncbi:TrbI/VirB10 family protein [Thermomonas fusca]|uniref:TrbI/VirB10 family protein n=1 Tax=Thermomonas fusca TaxID=215690 RepID=A0A5R9PBX7_9GAMM|nr:TrbI/VirB10 family protein [Thermomonas fusca]TLX20862.1 TrbI/VirB10 family protein [Thermomonas fusca]
MSNNFPPDYDEPARGTQSAADQRSSAADGNPYMRQNEQASPPDLDAAAPTLTVNEVRQLNRKAMLFLGGIVGLLLLMAFWFMSSLSNREKAAPKKAGAEVVTTPDLPQVTPQPALVEPAQPIDVVQNAPPLPPPPQSSYDDGYGDDMGASRAPLPPPSLTERRIADGGGQAGQGSGATQGMVPGMMQPPAPIQAEVTKPRTVAKLLNNPDALMVRGTYIRCVLETRIVTDVPGYTSCLVAEPVYSVNGRSLLFPKGTKLLGQYGGGGGGARERVAVVWDRAITPQGVDVTMASPGIDNLGGAGHPGQYDAHWGSRISSAILISMVSDLFKYMGEKNGPTTGVVYPQSGVVIEQPYQSNTAQTVQQLAQQALQEGANQRPTITINNGSILSVYVSQDVDFTGVLRSR